MTLAQFLDRLKSDLEADIGEGELDHADLKHIREAVSEILDRNEACAGSLKCGDCGSDFIVKDH